MLSDYKLNAGSFSGKDVKALPDKPNESGLSAAQLKAAFDKCGEEVIAGALNNVIDSIAGATGAAQIGTADGGTVQEHISRLDNPHNVLAGQTGAYTKAETNEQINARIQEISSADMMQATYDPQGKGTDIFAYAENIGALKQQKITANGILQGDGNGNITAANIQSSGIFTPKFAEQSGLTVTYTVQSGSYVITGNICNIGVELRGNISAASGALANIVGLPVAAKYRSTGAANVVANLVTDPNNTPILVNDATAALYSYGGVTKLLQTGSFIVIFNATYAINK